jgi:hypothetical protein
VNPESAADDGKTLKPSLPSKEPHGNQHAEYAQEMDTRQEGAQDTQPAVSTEGGVDVVKRWDDQVTYIEEEPWLEVDHNTWQGYRANV